MRNGAGAGRGCRPPLGVSESESLSAVSPDGGAGWRGVCHVRRRVLSGAARCGDGEAEISSTEDDRLSSMS